MSVKDRLKNYLVSKNIRINQFEKSIGASNGTVNNMRLSISPEKLEHISKIYNDLNIEWLLTGKGEMISMEGNFFYNLSMKRYCEMTYKKSTQLWVQIKTSHFFRVDYLITSKLTILRYHKY